MESPPRNEIIRKETHLRIQIFHQNKDDSKGYVLFESLLCLWNCKQKCLTPKKENTVYIFQCFQLKLITKSYLDEDSSTTPWKKVLLDKTGNILYEIVTDGHNFPMFL